MQTYLILAMVFALLVAVFAIQNAAVVDIRFFSWTFSGISLVLVILGSAVVGAVFTLLLGAPKQFSMFRRVKECQFQNRRLQEELDQIKGTLGAAGGVPDNSPEPAGTPNES